MNRLLPVVVLVALALPGAAHTAACSPLDCAPSQFLLAHGTMLAVRGGIDKPLRVLDLRTGATRWRLPPGIVAANVLVHQDGALLTWFDAATGARTGDAMLQQHGTFTLVGASQDGARAVLARTQHLSTTFAIVSRSSQRIVRLGGNAWAFDALNGPFLFLLRQEANGYQVRLFDLKRNLLERRPLKSPGESATLTGAAFARASSPDGRYVFTLYVQSDGTAMVHELDTVGGAAHCVDLPGTGDVSSALTWALVPDAGGSTLWAVSPGVGRVIAIDIATHARRESFAFRPGRWQSTPTTAVMSPDDARIAVTDAEHTWFVSLTSSTVARGPNHVAVALGFSPDERRLWMVGERGRVSALRLNWVH